MHQHAMLAHGVQVQIRDLQIVHLHPLDAGEEVVAETQVPSLRPAAATGVNLRLVGRQFFNERPIG